MVGVVFATVDRSDIRGSKPPEPCGFVSLVWSAPPAAVSLSMLILGSE
jgi:hypothetical protein